MIVSLILAAAIVITGLILYLHHRLTYGSAPAEPAAEATEDAEQCCGLHLTCEKGLTHSGEIIYFDDEELDTYKGRAPEEYTDPETEQFRDVLLTLLPTDIAGWAHSLELRGVSMPTAVRQEMMLIIAEQRAAMAAHP